MLIQKPISEGLKLPYGINAIRTGIEIINPMIETHLCLLFKNRRILATLKVSKNHGITA